MSELNRWIKIYNLIFTDTVRSSDLCRKDFDLKNLEVDYHNSISLYDIIQRFQKLYISFKKEYAILDKFELGKNIEIGQFVKYPSMHYRHLPIYIDKPVISNEEYTNLYLAERDNEIESYITNDANPFDDDYYRYDVDFDKKKVKKYLDLFEKYSIFVYLYNHFKTNFVFSDGMHTIFTKIHNKNSKTYDIDKFQISLGIDYINRGNAFDIWINFNDFSIDMDKSSFEIDNKNVEFSEKDCFDMLKNIYLSDIYLNTYWDRNNSKEKVNVRTLIKASDSL